MKIFQINCVYNAGSTGKIVADIHTELINRGHRSVVAYGRGKKDSAEFIYQTSNDFFGKLNNAFSRVTGLLYGGCFFETRRLIKIIKEEQPDIVHLHCLNGFFVNIFMLLKWLGEQNIKVVLTEHAEFMYTGSCGYSIDCNAWMEKGCNTCPQWKSETRSLFGDKTSKAWTKMKTSFDYIKKENLQIVDVSPWLEKRSKQSLILKNFRHSVVFNGIDTDVFKQYNLSKEQIFPASKDKLVIFHATAMFSNNPNHIKGGYYLLKLAEQMKDMPVHFYVAGTYEAGISVPENVTLLGRVDNQAELAKYYSCADLTLLTSKRETFSMICAESLCCGTPIVGFYAGAPETVSIAEYSSFVDFGDVDAMKNAAVKMLDMHHSKDEIALSAKALYSKQRMVDDYCNIYNELCDKKGS